MARKRISYLRVPAPKPVIPAGASDAERKAADDWDAMLTLLAWLEGHGRCGGWVYDPDRDGLRCECGALGFQITDPATGAAA